MDPIQQRPHAVGFLFPGQGAQYVGMGKDLYDTFPSVKNVFNQAEKILGFSIAQICFEGPEDKLTRTLYAQPAIFVTSYAVLTVLREKFPELAPALAAGLSLGEFSALVAAGSLTFEDGLRLVAVRAEAMEQSGKKYPGTMASIMGLSESDCTAIAAEAGCEVANLNSPDQIALSGTFASIEKACKLATDRGAKRALTLKVGGAFHSTLMRDAKEHLEKVLAATPVKQPFCSFYPNVLAEKVQDPEMIRMLLSKQLMSPVRWVHTMAQAEKEGIRFFLEIGPGRVLKGLAKKSQPSLTVMPCGTKEDFQKIEEIFGKIETK